MGESIKDLLCSVGGVEGSIAATNRGMEGSVDMIIIVEGSFLCWGCTFHFKGIKSVCRPFYLFFLVTNFHLTVDIIYFEAYVSFLCNDHCLGLAKR